MLFLTLDYEWNTFLSFPYCSCPLLALWMRWTRVQIRVCIDCGGTAELVTPLSQRWKINETHCNTEEGVISWCPTFDANCSPADGRTVCCGSLQRCLDRLCVWDRLRSGAFFFRNTSTRGILSYLHWQHQQPQCLRGEEWEHCHNAILWAAEELVWALPSPCPAAECSPPLLALTHTMMVWAKKAKLHHFQENTKQVAKMMLSVHRLRELIGWSTSKARIKPLDGKYFGNRPCQKKTKLPSHISVRLRES